VVFNNEFWNDGIIWNNIFSFLHYLYKFILRKKIGKIRFLFVYIMVLR